MTEQRHKEAIKRLVLHDGNNECAECQTPEPGYASISLGIFLCPVCAKLHQKNIKKLSEVVAIVNHKWTKEEVDFMYTEGNKVVNAKFEKYLPIYYHRPRRNDPRILLEQWILAKYIRDEFKEQSQQSAYSQSTKTGALFKRLKDQEKFQRRKFILSVNEGKLMYFIKYSDKTPKDTILIRNLINVYLVPDKLGNENGMQITYEKDGMRRNLYVFGENGKSTTDWYHAIRSAMARVKYRDFNDADIKKYLNTTIIMEGWMTKTGPKKHEKFRRRWFTLVGTAVWYYTHPLDAHPLGYIPLGSKTFGYAVMRGFPKGIREDGYGLTVHTPERVYVLNCTNQGKRDEWEKNIERVLVACTSIWKKPAVCSNNEKPKENVINLDELDDLAKPSKTSVFTGMHSSISSSPKSKNAKGSPFSDECDVTDSIGNTGTVESNNGGEASEQTTRTPLFVKNTRAGQRKEAKITAKTNTEKIKPRHGGTVKIRKKSAEEIEDDGDDEEEDINEFGFRAPSKRYSDDSESSGSDVEVVQPSFVHRRTHQLISDADSEKSGALSSGTEEDSEEDVVVLRRARLSGSNDDGSMSVKSRTASDKRHSFPRLSPRAQSPTLVQSPLARPRSTLDMAQKTSPPKKPPRRNIARKNSEADTSSSSSDQKAVRPSDFELLHRKNFHLSHETIASSLSASFASVLTEDDEGEIESPGVQMPIESPNLLSPDDIAEDNDNVRKWRATTFFTSVRRVEGKERKLMEKGLKSSNTIAVDPRENTVEDTPPRPIDLTICNNTDNKLWFMLFQCEEEMKQEESYTTPWLGAEIAEMPASVGPIRLPHEFEIAIIDTAPGGFGLLRTTGPFYTQPGEVWEVDMPVDDGSAPDMFYHEGMQTEDGSVVVYSNVENSKKFEVALFKSGRKLFSRKNINPGESAAFKVHPSLYIMRVNQELYYSMEDEDIKASEIISKSSEIRLDYKMPKLRISAREKDDTIHFTSQTAYSFKTFYQSRHGPMY